MPTLRVMSWNIRTLGSHNLLGGDYSYIRDIILNSQADIICIQELQIGDDIPLKVGSPISERSVDIIRSMYFYLSFGDSGSNWDWAVSGSDSNSKTSMRDAYAFLYKKTPAKSKSAHKDPVDTIAIGGPPAILQQNVTFGPDRFPGRRPGMATFQIKAGAVTVPVNIISYHAATPCNVFNDGASAGINALSSLNEIGGGKFVYDSSSRTYSYDPTLVNPLPSIDTIVLGDFNYSADKSDANLAYANLITNYIPCVNTPGGSGIRLTTYSADPTQPFKQTSAYDNIFVLKAHDSFKPSLAYNGTSNVIDFIAAESVLLGTAAEIRYFAKETAWYTVYVTRYKGQHCVGGISDHLPVTADFTVGNGSNGAAIVRILPTDGSNNNCMFHALFGVLNPVTGYYTCANAAGLRKNFYNALIACINNSGFPNANVRRSILGALINTFSNTPLMRDFCQQLLEAPDFNPLSPGSYGGGVPVSYNYFIDKFRWYAFAMWLGRMMYVEELEAVAQLNDVKVRLYYLNRGQYFYQDFNAGGTNGPVTIFHQGVHFSRYNAS